MRGPSSSWRPAGRGRSNMPAFKRTIVLGALLLVSAGAALRAHAATGKVKWFNEAKGFGFRMTHDLEHGARDAGITLDTSNIGYADANGNLIVNMAVAGVDQLSPKDFAGGVDTMFIAVDYAGQKFPAGF